MILWIVETYLLDEHIKTTWNSYTVLAQDFEEAISKVRKQINEEESRELIKSVRFEKTIDLE
jgi:hypothetical protein